MKRLLRTLLILALSLVLSLSAMADVKTAFEKDYAKEGDIVLASFNGVKPFLADLRTPEALEDACYWLGDYAASLGIRYVSFTGAFSSGSTYTYANYIKPLGKTMSDMADANDKDPDMLKEVNAFKTNCMILKDANLPYGISIAKADYYSNAYTRDNLIEVAFDSDDYEVDDDSSKTEILDANNLVVTLDSGDEKYMVFQLEAYPRLEVINWFNSVVSANPDKRVFVYTTSLTDSNGAFYTQFDPNVYTYQNAPEHGNTTLLTQMVLMGKPHDGVNIWKYALEPHDNIVAVVSSNASVGKSIVVSTFKNSRGYEVVSVLANLEGGYAAEGAYPLLMKFSESEQTLDLRYAVPYYNKVGGYVKDSQKTVSLNIASLPDPDPVTLLPKIKTQINGSNKAYINGYAGNIFKPQSNMTKAEASIIFARLLEGSQTIPSGYTTRFTDVKSGDWFYNAIAYLDTLGFYFTNTSDKYNPNAPITRAEFVELAYFASDIQGDAGVKFKDVPEGHKYYDAIIAAAASGLVNGYEDNTFRPDATITRAEVVTIINRLLSLIVNKYTVAEESLSNKFSDISGHWAEKQILMASNDNVKSSSHYSVKAGTLTDKGSEISFGNKHLKVSINKKDGKVTEAIYLPTGENVLQTSSNPWFSYGLSSTGATILPTAVEVVDELLKVTYKGGSVVYFVIHSYDDYFTVEPATDLPDDIKTLHYGCIDFNYTASETEGTFRASGVAMDVRTLTAANPGGYTSLVGANTAHGFGSDAIGAKIGLVFSKMEEHREILKDVVMAIDPEYGITSDHGGPFTYDRRDIYDDYSMVSGEFNQATVDEYIELALKYSVDQFDVHQGSQTFYQGDFNFVMAGTEEELARGEFIPASKFKERIADKVHAAGLKVGLHTYSSLVSSVSTKILSSPKWIKQICYNEKTYTVRGEMAKFRNNIKTYEDASDFVGYNLSYNQADTCYLLIDEEIIRVEKGSTSGFLNIKRGQFGTEAAVHKDGAEIRQLQGFYGGFQPIPGSELWNFIASETARAYNEGGFDMIYLDGLESFVNFIPQEVRNYYYADFYRRVLAECKKSPIIEDSAGTAISWAARGRSGALDSVVRGIKRNVSRHARPLIKARERYYTATLGWFNFDPDGGEFRKNTIKKTIFRDDLDYMGSIAIAADLLNTDNQFSLTEYSQPDRHADNFNYYGVYTRLRKGGYFAPEVRSEILKGEYEFRLFEKADGSFAFREMKYVKNIVFDMKDKNYVTGNDNNPFGAHTPFVRIEQRFSTLSENEKLVLALDENGEVSKAPSKSTIPEINLSKNLALKVKVYGNGSADGGILISLYSSLITERGHVDYFIPTSHTGWREFILVDADNAEHPGADFPGISYEYNAQDVYRATPSLNRIATVEIRVRGNVAGVRMDDIRAYTETDAPAKNPSVTIGKSTITFNTEIHSGEFIEYYPDTNKAYLNYYTPIYNEEGKFVIHEAHTKEISFTGSITAPAGAYSYTYDAEAMTEAPLRARVTIGLQGRILENPEGWAVPEIDMGDATLDVIIK